MQYTSARNGYNHYKVKKDSLNKIKKVKTKMVIGASIIITFCSLNLLKNYNSASSVVSSMYEYENDIPDNLLANTKAGFDTNILKNNNTNIKNEIIYTFIKYCDIYNVDFNTVYNKASLLTNNFTSDDFIKNNRIIGTRACQKERIFDNMDIGILCFVRHVKQIPEDFGFDSSDIKSKKNYCETDFCEEIVNNYCENFVGLEKELCMAIIYSENHRNLSGEKFVDDNNPGCLTNGEGEFVKFENISQGIIEMMVNLKYRYLEDMNLYNSSLEKMVDSIQPVYAPLDDPKNKDIHINENWAPNVKRIYAELKNDYYSIYKERNGLSR